MQVGEDFQPPPVVNLDGSELLLARHIKAEKIILFWVPVGVHDRRVCEMIDIGARRNLFSQRLKEALHQLPTLRPPEH